MASEFNDSDFVDRDFQAARAASPFGGGVSTAGGSNRPPSRDELDTKAVAIQQQLAEIKRALEDKERERNVLEEARRRQIEFDTGRQEMLQSLTRGIGLLEEAEFAARRDSEQMARTLGDLRDSLAKVHSIQEEVWNQQNYNTELTRALTTIENARMEWNSARLKWTILSGQPPQTGSGAESEGTHATGSIFSQQTPGSLWKLGLALTWPLVIVGLLAGGAALFLLLRR